MATKKVDNKAKITKSTKQTKTVKETKAINKQSSSNLKATKKPTKRKQITEDTPLSQKEQTFIERYLIHGNGTRAAQEAGYTSKSQAGYTAKGSEILRKINVVKKLGELREERKQAHIATAEEVMQYFTKVMNGEIKDQFGLDASLRDRNDAGKELAKRTIDIDNRLKGIADQKVDNELKITLDWSRK